MVLIKITNKKNTFTKISEEDLWLIQDYKWRISPAGYVYALMGKKSVLLHRYIMNVDRGGPTIDHKNGDRLDNQRDNLRKCSTLENNRNKRRFKNNLSGFKGVRTRKSRNCFDVYICINYKEKFLGSFTDAHEGAKAYDAAAIKYFGEYARLNFPQKSEALRG